MQHITILEPRGFPPQGSSSLAAKPGILALGLPDDDDIEDTLEEGTADLGDAAARGQTTDTTPPGKTGSIEDEDGERF